jgi:hypothetical protein
MRARNKTTMTLIASIAAAGAVAAATLPANASDKGDSSSSRVTAKTVTGGAVAGKHAAPKVSTGVGAQLRTGDVCSAYGDGHGDLCLWYFSNYGGSRTGFLRNDANLVDDRFVSAGAGQNAVVTNNAESVWNYDRFVTAWVATSPNYAGSNGFISPNSGGNLNATYKNNSESIFWAS